MVLKLKCIKNILNAVLVMKCYVVTMISIPNRCNSYHGVNAVYKFMEKMLEEVKKCRNTIKYKFNQDNLRYSTERGQRHDSLLRYNFISFSKVTYYVNTSPSKMKPNAVPGVFRITINTSTE